jgi:hypothetical protein
MLLFLLQTASESAYWYAQPITVATIVIAVATVVYTVITLRLLKITKDIFEASHRPYIGVFKMKPERDDEAKQLKVTIVYKNIGNVPAKSVKPSVQLFMNGFAIQMSHFESKTAVLMPQQRLHRTILFSEADYMKISDGAKLDVVFSVHYKGMANKEYDYRHESTYSRDNNLFMVVEVTSTETG